MIYGPRKRDCSPNNRIYRVQLNFTALCLFNSSVIRNKKRSAYIDFYNAINSANNGRKYKRITQRVKIDVLSMVELDIAHGMEARSIQKSF